MDKVGNWFTRFLAYRVVYRLCLQYDPAKASTIGASIVLKAALCNSAGTTVTSSSPAVLTAVVVNNNTSLLSPNGPGGSNPTFKFSYDSKSKLYQYTLKTDSRFLKTPQKNWLSFRVSTDPQTPTGSVSDVAYLDKLYRVYFLLK